MYMAIFGLFSFVWFGWAQERPRPKWRLPLGIASGAALLACGFGIYLSVINWNAPSALNEQAPFLVYLITFWAQFVIIGAGSFILIRRKKSGLVAPWVLFIVGLHFISLVFVFNDPLLFLLAALLTGAAVASIFVAPKLAVANSAIAGIGAGTILLGFALLGLGRYLLT
jgi:hypothetical protein